MVITTALCKIEGKTASSVRITLSRNKQGNNHQYVDNIALENLKPAALQQTSIVKSQDVFQPLKNQDKRSLFS